MPGDTYHTITGESSGLYKDRGSKFIGVARPVASEQDVKVVLQELKKEHFSAAHHCYAYVLGSGSDIQKSNDDREPANSAGKPILRAILSRQLTYTLVVVVRYFGGKLLGVPGLIQAYGGAAEEALATATIAEKVIYERYHLQFDYAQENEAFRIVKQFGLKVLGHTQGQRSGILFEVRRSLAPQVLDNIREKRIFELSPADL